jgi:hypothetical protein
MGRDGLRGFEPTSIVFNLKAKKPPLPSPLLPWGAGETSHWSRFSWHASARSTAPLDATVVRRSLKEESVMKTKLHVGGPVQCFSRKLFLVGAGVALGLFPLSIRGDGCTNFVSSDFPSIPVNLVAPGRVVTVLGFLGANPPSVAASQLALPSNQMTFGAMNAGAAARIARVLAAAPLLSAQTDPDFTLGVRRLELIEPSPALERQQAGETTKGLAVRFFVPNVSVSSPQGGRNGIVDESDRPWAVISGGAATGKSWNEPDTYRAQGYLTLHW